MSHTAPLPVVRFTLAGILSLITTFLLFFLMQDLIRITTNVLPENSNPGIVLRYVRVPEDTPVAHRIRVVQPPTVHKHPPLPKVNITVDQRMTAIPIPANHITGKIDRGARSNGGIQIGEGDILPIFKVTPVYPLVALTKGIQGYTIVEFTVTASGATRDVRVIEAQPAGVFNRVSIDAAAKFKYKPRVINGTPVEVHGVENKFIFKLK